MPISSKDTPGTKEPTKADLLEEAEEAGVDVPKSATKAEIRDALATETSGKGAQAIYVANQTGVTNLDGAMFQFRAGVTHVSADDPAYKAHPEMFSPVADRARPVIEQATAEPGKKRGE